ncbi:MAG TPA: zinc finger protein [Pyrinomonadaceae bacterium]|nr:zinc finger protein [Pyrinomonadaceae bacterium]
MATYEGKWRCIFCSAVNRGRDLDCANCGVRRGADVEFFLEDDAPAVADEARLREANDGPDWLCETCGGSNRFSLTTCQTCGAPRGNSSLREVLDGAPGAFRDPQADEQSARRAADFSHDETHTAGDRQGSDEEWSSATANDWRGRGWTPSLTVICIIVGGIILLAFLAFSHSSSPTPKVAPEVDRREVTFRDIDLVVDRVEWVRSIEVEEYRQVTREDWEDEVPADAKVISRRQDVHHYDHVKTGSHIKPEYYTERVRTGSHTETEHYTEREQSGTQRYRCGTRNKGNGYFEDVYCTRPEYRTVTKSRSRQVDDYRTVTRSRDRVVEDFKDVPVHRTKVSYSVKRWIPADTVVAQGADLKPYWPKVSVSAKKRAGQQTETYLVFFHDAQGKMPYERQVGADEFALFTTGVTCRARVNGFNQIVDFTPPAGKTSQ